MSEPAVAVAAVTVNYGRTTALNGVNLSVPAGSVFGLLGHNGAGKTSLMRLLAGLNRPDSEIVRVFGCGRPVQWLGRVAYVPEQPACFRWMSGLEFLGFLARLNCIPERRAREALSSDSVRQWVGSFALKPIATYSRGQRQRLAIASALLGDPDLLILDEPMNALDPEGRQDFFALVDLWRKAGKTVILSTHILPDAERVCDHLAVVRQGNVLVQGRMANVLGPLDRPIIRGL
ncbi:MAG: ABC transporter ATP-binding protein [Bacillota bacterium]